MQHEFMATFHLFTSLPLELRIQIWAQVVTHERVLRVRPVHHSRAYWSPTPVPAITRACRESQKYCSYVKAFEVTGSMRYIWTCFESDIIQMEGYFLEYFAKRKDSLETTKFRHFRLELFDKSWENSALFAEVHSYRLPDFPKLERCDILVENGLRNWGGFIKRVDPKIYMRIVDAKTGEWFDKESEGPCMDYMDNFFVLGPGLIPELDISYDRIDDNWDERNNEDVKERFDAMIKVKEEGLPRIDLVN